MKATPRAGLAGGDFDDESRGQFEIVTQPDGRRFFWVVCPGCGVLAALAIRPAAPDHPSWELSGTPEAPTLRPSINHQQCWHGWLTAGEFTLA